MGCVRRACFLLASISFAASASVSTFTVLTSDALYNFCPRTEHLGLDRESLLSFLEAELLETPDSIDIERAFPIGRNFTHRQSKSQPNRSLPVKLKYTHT
jgi:hypothetical protein